MASMPDRYAEALLSKPLLLARWYERTKAVIPPQFPLVFPDVSLARRESSETVPPVPSYGTSIKLADGTVDTVCDGDPANDTVPLALASDPVTWVSGEIIEATNPFFDL